MCTLPATTGGTAQTKSHPAVGAVAARNLLQSDDAVGRLRGGQHEYNGIPVVVTYHPAYLLRSPEQKAKAWQDLQKAARLIQ